MRQHQPQALQSVTPDVVQLMETPLEEHARHQQSILPSVLENPDTLSTLSTHTSIVAVVESYVSAYESGEGQLSVAACGKPPNLFTNIKEEQIDFTSDATTSQRNLLVVGGEEATNENIAIIISDSPEEGETHSVPESINEKVCHHNIPHVAAKLEKIIKTASMELLAAQRKLRIVQQMLVEIKEMLADKES